MQTPGGPFQACVHLPPHVCTLTTNTRTDPHPHAAPGHLLRPHADHPRRTRRRPTPVPGDLLANPVCAPHSHACLETPFQGLSVSVPSH